MSVRLSEVCGVFPATNHTHLSNPQIETVEEMTTVSSVASRQTPKLQKFDAEGGNLAESEVDRTHGRGYNEMVDATCSPQAQMGPARAG